MRLRLLRAAGRGWSPVSAACDPDLPPPAMAGTSSLVSALTYSGASRPCAPAEASRALTVQCLPPNRLPPVPAPALASPGTVPAPGPPFCSAFPLPCEADLCCLHCIISPDSASIKSVPCPRILAAGMQGGV